MEQYQNWNQLDSMHPSTNEKPYISLRPGDNSVRNFAVGQRRHLAVHTTRPYGDLSDSDMPGLLAPVSRGDDFTVFEMSQSTLALKALSLGTGSQRAELLHGTYRSVGQTIGRILAAGVRPDHLTINDVAVDRYDGAVYIIPPVNFQRVPGSETVDSSSLAASLSELRSVFSPEDIASFQADLEEGLQL